jgi:hypothetical protein
MFPYDFLIYVNFKFDLLDSMDLKRHILMCTLICIFSCSCRWLGERSEVLEGFSNNNNNNTITRILRLLEAIDSLDKSKEHSLSL